MTLRELVETCNFKDLHPILLQLCDGYEGNIPYYKVIFDGLRFRKFIPSNDIIRIQKDDEFSTEDKILYHVNMFCPDEQKTYGFCGMRDENLSMEVVLNEGISLSNAEIVANCIWEMTFHGFTDEEIQERIYGKVEDTEEFRMAKVLINKKRLFNKPVSVIKFNHITIPENCQTIPENVIRQVNEALCKERAMNGPKRKRMRRWEKRIEYLERRSKIKLDVRRLVKNTDFDENDVSYLFDTHLMCKHSFTSCAENIYARAPYMTELICDYLFEDYTEYTRFCLMFKFSSEHPITPKEKEQLGKIRDLFPQESTITWGYGINENLGENIELLFFLSR